METKTIYVLAKRARNTHTHGSLACTTTIPPTARHLVPRKNASFFIPRLDAMTSSTTPLLLPPPSLSLTPRVAGFVAPCERRLDFDERVLDLLRLPFRRLDVVDPAVRRLGRDVRLEGFDELEAGPPNGAVVAATVCTNAWPWLAPAVAPAPLAPPASNARGTAPVSGGGEDCGVRRAEGVNEDPPPPAMVALPAERALEDPADLPVTVSDLRPTWPLPMAAISSCRAGTFPPLPPSLGTPGAAPGTASGDAR